MTAILVPIAVLVIMLIAVSLITRLIATAMLNKTIREAIKHHPESVPVLAARLEAGQPWADRLFGWIMTALALGLAIIAPFEEASSRPEMFKVAVILAVVGITTLLYLRFGGVRQEQSQG